MRSPSRHKHSKKHKKEHSHKKSKRDRHDEADHQDDTAEVSEGPNSSAVPSDANGSKNAPDDLSALREAALQTTKTVVDAESAGNGHTGDTADTPMAEAPATSEGLDENV